MIPIISKGSPTLAIRLTVTWPIAKTIFDSNDNSPFTCCGKS